MSGSSGGGGGGYGTGSVSCNDLKFTTQLASPQQHAVGSLQIGQVLQVDIVSIKLAQVLVVQAFGVTVGSLVGSNATRLRECILGGHRYQATVMQVSGGQVTVDIEHV